MTLIVQIVLGLAVLVGLVTIIMSSKNWHWTQLVLVLFIFFTGIGFLFLGAETVRIHRNLRAGIPKLEKQLAGVEKQNDELLNGAGDRPGILELDHRLQIVTRERGRAWRGVMPAGQVDQQGRVAVEIAKPQPHGLAQDAIVYAFKSGDPAQGAEYLGEFRVTAVQETGATLEPVLLVDNRMGRRLDASEGPWSLYETMPIDRHRLFTGLTEEQLREMLPPESVEEYIRHGSEATPDDDEWHVIGFNDKDERVGTENMDQAVKRLYDRDLRDYAFIFNQLAGEKVAVLAQQRAVTEDNVKLTKALAGAEATGEFRQQQIDALSSDLAGMKQDRSAIESHRDAVLGQLQQFESAVKDYQQVNSTLAKQLSEQQLGLVRYINSVAPAPSATSLLD